MEEKDTEKKRRTLPVGWKIALFLFLIAMIPGGVFLLFKLFGAPLAVAYGLAAILFVWPFLMRFGARRLYTMRNDYIKAVRADKTPVVSVPQVLGLYAIIFSPSFLLAFIALSLPWGTAMGIYFIPSVVLLILFGIMHGGAWGDLQLPRLWYIVYLAALLALSSLAGMAVNTFIF